MALKRTAICPECGHSIPRRSMPSATRCVNCGVALEMKRFSARQVILFAIGLQVPWCLWPGPASLGFQYLGVTDTVLLFLAVYFPPLLALPLVIYGMIPWLIRYEMVGTVTCAKCGYDLRASKGSCPECGEPIPPRVDGESSNVLSRK